MGKGVNVGVGVVVWIADRSTIIVCVYVTIALIVVPVGTGNDVADEDGVVEVELFISHPVSTANRRMQNAFLKRRSALVFIEFLTIALRANSPCLYSSNLSEFHPV